MGELRYKPWGETRYTWGSTPTDRQYTGQINEDDIGLYFYNARFYDPALGRFVSPDTVVPAASQGVQAWDRYAYVNNSPVTYADPTGHVADSGCRTEGCSASEGELYSDYVYNVIYAHENRQANTAKAEAFLNTVTELGLSFISPPVALFFQAINDEQVSGLDLALAFLPGAGKLAGEGLGSLAYADDAAKFATEASGQWHHALSNKIMRALNKHETLQGIFNRDDLLVQAADKASHNGYQSWHIAYDNEVVDWLSSTEGAKASASKFLEYLGGIYGRTEMQNSFPGATDLFQLAIEEFK